MFCAKKLKSSQQDTKMQQRIIELSNKCAPFAVGLGSKLRESFMNLDNTLQGILLTEAKLNPSLNETLGFGKCQFCKQILKNDFDSFTTHMFWDHHDIVKNR